MSRFANEAYKNIQGYVMGEQPRDRKYIKLNANESPYPPSPKVMAAVTKEKLRSQSLYADPHNAELTATIAERYGVEPNQVYTDGGSDVILGYIIHLFGDSSHPFCFPDVTYGFYRTCANTFGIAYEEIPLNRDFTVNPEDYTACGKNILLANPNAPTGLVLSLKQIERMVSTNPNNLVVIDEAYVDFGNETCIPLVYQYDNLIVVHTMSKSRCLAGARVGYAISSKEIVADLNAMKASFNPDSISTLSQAAGTAAVKDEAYMREVTAKIMRTRESTCAALRKLGFEVLDSHTNFLLVRPSELSAKDYAEKLREEGILVRYYAQPRIDQYVRMTVGNDLQMAEVLNATNLILQRKRNILHSRRFAQEF